MQVIDSSSWVIAVKIIDHLDRNFWIWFMGGVWTGLELWAKEVLALWVIRGRVQKTRMLIGIWMLKAGLYEVAVGKMDCTGKWISGHVVFHSDRNLVNILFSSYKFL